MPGLTRYTAHMSKLTRVETYLDAEDLELLRSMAEGEKVSRAEALRRSMRERAKRQEIEAIKNRPLLVVRR